MMVGHNLSLESGLCSAINKGKFVHADDTSTPKHFSCFLSPPMKDVKNMPDKNAPMRLGSVKILGRKYYSSYDSDEDR